uniref:NADH-ubiquinone oxidoreductase chain 6 n=1 Tax=Petroscirtes breviceps TaxID=57847 RepID=Q8HKT9_PETBE|nr:NADH dehydrogenase subunit 6 [Petroscirtes breviceps]BAC23759.1 NADH dehydrogenase subunit 6 [Petroscirtes breviceps]
MYYTMYILFVGVLVGAASVAANPSPYYAAFGLVVMAVSGCGVVGLLGGTLLSLVLVLIYLGGMLVVFAYSAAMAAEPYPEAWLSLPVFLSMLVYMLGAAGAGVILMSGWMGGGLVLEGEAGGLGLEYGNIAGVSFLYSTGGGLLLAAGWGLLLTLFAVLELVRGLSRGAIRIK